MIPNNSTLGDRCQKRGNPEKVERGKAQRETGRKKERSFSIRKKPKLVERGERTDREKHQSQENLHSSKWETEGRKQKMRGGGVRGGSKFLWVRRFGKGGAGRD